MEIAWPKSDKLPDGPEWDIPRARMAEAAKANAQWIADWIDNRALERYYALVYGESKP